MARYDLSILPRFILQNDESVQACNIDGKVIPSCRSKQTPEIKSEASPAFIERAEHCDTIQNCADRIKIGQFAVALSSNALIMPKHIRIFNWLLLFLIILTAFIMFHIKSQVQDLKFELRQIKSQISQELNQHDILKAELAYLKSPERLSKLSAQYLQLEMIKPIQIVREGNKKISYSIMLASSGAKSAKKWRYKKMGSHIKNVSAKKN